MHIAISQMSSGRPISVVDISEVSISPVCHWWAPFLSVLSTQQLVMFMDACQETPAAGHCVASNSKEVGCHQSCLSSWQMQKVDALILP